MVNRVLIFFIQGLRPLLGPSSCKFEVTCGNFAVQQLQEKPLFIAVWAITKQLLACNPLTR